MKKISFLIIKLFISFSVFGQDIYECKQMVEEVFSKFQKAGTEVPDGKMFYLNYSVEAELRGNKNQAGKQEIKAVFTSDNAMILSDFMELYVDTKNSFTVLPNEKRVLWSKSTRGFGEELRKKYAVQLKDNLLNYSHISQCKSSNWKNSKMLKITLQFNAKGINAFNYRTIDLWISPKSLELKRAVLNFSKKGNIEKIDMHFNEMNFDYNGRIIPIDFEKKNIINGKLRESKYSGYQLTDLRK